MKKPSETEEPALEGTHIPGEAGDSRRAFLKKSAGVAVTAPAVSLLLSASLKPDQAQAALYWSETGWWPPDL